ncbi:MAG: hypothetical protein QG629_339 [Patescibacteria group bacterium]|nr:tyrosine-protein phosphatase [Candidatus Saccharibacteria bacterium]MDQ5963257.1 hypothetical protein [Patescibacteria group bacterium]
MKSASVKKQIQRSITTTAVAVFFLTAVLPAINPSRFSAEATVVSISSAKNFRDAADSNNDLKSGMLYRSGQLNALSKKDREKLATALRGGVIIDVRDLASRRKSPDKNVAGVRNVSIPIDGVLNQTPMVTDATRRAQVGKALKLAANSDGPVLVHCFEGKDRTGWVVSMILYISGSSDQEIMKEYMKSAKAWPGGVKQSWLTAGLRAAEKKYGSRTNYLKKGVGLTDGDIQKIRKKFKSGSTTVDPDTGGNKPDKKPKKKPQSSKSGKFRIASYNVLGSNHVADGTRVGRCAAGRGCTETRAQNVENVIEGKSGSAAYDIVGMQEVRNDQLNYFNRNLEDYAHSKVKDSSGQTIYWNKDRFKLIKSGGIRYPYFNNTWDTGPWVLLLDKTTNQKFYVFNHHPPAHNGSDHGKAGGALKREKSAHIVANWIDKTYAKDKFPIFVLGDMNSRNTFMPDGKDAVYKNDRSRLPYCILTKSGIMRYSFDALAKRTGACPLKKGVKGFSVDFVLVSKGVKVYKTATMNIARASDHKPVFADVSLGAADDDGGGTGNGNGDNKPPTVEITTPTDGTTIDKGVSLAAKATDDGSGIEKVDFYRDDKRIVTDRTAPYIKKWNTKTLPNTPAGKKIEVYAIAYDKAGNETKSSPIKVVIDHRATPSQKKVSLAQNGKTISVMLSGSCSKNLTAASTATSPAALKGKNIVAGLSFNAQCIAKGDGANVEIDLGGRYNHSILRAYKEKGGQIEDATGAITVADRATSSGDRATYLVYSIVDGGKFDSDGAKNAAVQDPLFVTHGDAVTTTPVTPTEPTKPTDNEDTDDASSTSGPVVTTPSKNGNVTVTTTDGHSVTTNADGTIVSGKGKGVLPNTGTSAVILGAAALATVMGWLFVRNRRRAAIQSVRAVDPLDYSLNEMVQSQQNEANMVPSKGEDTER